MAEVKMLRTRFVAIDDRELIKAHQDNYYCFRDSVACRLINDGDAELARPDLTVSRNKVDMELFAARLKIANGEQNEQS